MYLYKNKQIVNKSLPGTFPDNKQDLIIQK